MKLFSGLLQKCRTIGHRNKSFGCFAAFWSCFCIVQQCWAKAVALCREAAGAIDLGASQVLHCPRFDPVLWFESLVLSMGSEGCSWSWPVSLERNPADVC